MNDSKPGYYTSLAPFASWFGEGLPILTWHKVGPRPRGTRLKGMYLSARLFERQLAELQRAGYSSICLNDYLPLDNNAQRHMVLTFDDGYVSVLKPGLTLLNRYRFHAIQFLVADRLGQTNDWDAGAGEVREPLMDGAQVKEWMAAGHEIGAHTLTHPILTRLPLDRAREEIVGSKKKLEDMFGKAVEHFCYPYGDWNPMVRDLVIEAGYQTACTTEFGINKVSTSPHELRRLTARYASRNLRQLMQKIRALLGKIQ